MYSILPSSRNHIMSVLKIYKNNHKVESLVRSVVSICLSSVTYVLYLNDKLFEQVNRVAQWLPCATCYVRNSHYIGIILS